MFSILPAAMCQTSEPDIHIVVPCHNEAESLPILVDEVAGALAGGPWRVSLIAVDDGSTDETWATIERLAISSTAINVRGLRLARNMGKASAQAIGIRDVFGVGGFVAVMDADGQHSPEDLVGMLEKAINDDTAVLGHRINYQRSAVSNIGTRLLVVASRLLGSPYDPATSEFAVLPPADALALARDPLLGFLPVVPLIEQSARRRALVDITVRKRVGDDRRTNWQLSMLGQKGLLHLFANPWGLLPRLALLLGTLAAALLMYGLVVGIVSIASGSFLGIASVLVALVIVFLGLAIVGILTLGLSVLLLVQHQHQQNAPEPQVERSSS